MELKKNRKAERAFIAETPKVVGDIMAYIKPRMIAATKEWIAQNIVNANGEKCGCDVFEVTEYELRQISMLQNPQQVLAVFPQQMGDIGQIDLTHKLTLALDDVQDPGNLGTIIRIADWFGITDVICGTNTADIYNNKVVQATMGSLARVNVVYTDLHAFIASLPPRVNVYGTFLDGENIYGQELSGNGLVVVGNEGNGISPALEAVINNKLFIPSYPKWRKTTDSLNVAVATAIICNEFRRQSTKRE